MKKLILIIIFLISFDICASAQDCFNQFYTEGKKAYSELDFEKALNQFKAAKICDDIPSNSDINKWINKTKDGYIQAILDAKSEVEKEKKML